MTLHERETRLLLGASNWVTATLEADPQICGVILAACSQVMLRLWENRYTGDGRIPLVVEALRRWAAAPSLQSQREVAAANTKVSVIDDTRWWLSPVDEPPRMLGGDTPADFAGDAIVWAARAVSELADEHEFRVAAEKALEFGLEAVARQLDAYHPDECATEWSVAHTKLRSAILVHLGEQSHVGIQSR